MTFHAYGQYILYPYSYDYQSHAPNQAEMDSVGTQMEAAVRAVHRHRYTMGQGQSCKITYPSIFPKIFKTEKKPFLKISKLETRIEIQKISSKSQNGQNFFKSQKKG